MELPPGLSEMERVAELCFRSRDGTAALETWLAGGADPDERDSLGNTMFSGIVLSSPYREQVERVRILIKYGASVDLECSAPPSWSPLHLCAMQQNHACMALLLDAGADIDKYGPNGCTPLMAAAGRTNSDGSVRDISGVRLLVSRGAKLDLRQRLPEGHPLHATHRQTAEEMCGSTWEIQTFPMRGACHAFLRDVRLAGGYRRYVNAPRKTIIVLRQLVLRGRATPPHALVKLFADSTPKEIVWRVLKFWRSDREPLLPPVEHSGYPPSGHHEQSDIYEEVDGVVDLYGEYM